MKRRRQTAAATAERLPQPHGGALLAGGVHGNAGGLGSAPSQIRVRCRGSFEQRIPILEQIADGTLRQLMFTPKGVVEIEPNFNDRSKAIDLLGKYGGIEKLSVDVQTDGADRTGEEIVAAFVERLPRLFAIIPVAKRDKLKMLRAIRVKETDLAVNE